ncbi:MAG TPA: hypothetical protein DHW64_12540 [Chitinophagaceae bacterium]|nr:hypothetical protein [Chitinophagaceae bacterium]
MKKVSLMVGVLWMNVVNAQSIDPVSMILAKAIKVIDLKVQRLQYETMVLQRLQEVAEQKLSTTKLAEIRKWQDQLQRLYADYFQEMRQAKTVITSSVGVQRTLVRYQELIRLYAGLHSADMDLANEFLGKGKSAYQTLLKVTNDGISMSDAERLEMIQVLNNVIEQSLIGIRSISEKHKQQFMQVEKRKNDNQQAKKIYGLQ